MAYFYNIGSIALGLAAWAIALAAIVRSKSGKGASMVYPGASFCACSLALLLQIFELNRRVEINDLSAVMDTIRAIAFAASTLIIVTVILNLIVLFAGRNKR